jgi:hypothetical protein
VEGGEQLKCYITDYYKKLFVCPDRGRLSLNESSVEDIPQVTDEESEGLVKEFSEKEV